LGYLYCPRGYTGINCDIDIDECNTTTVITKICPELCVNFPGGYNCVCYDGTTNCLEDLPEMVPEPAQGLSTSIVLVIAGVIVFVIIIGVSIFVVFIKKDTPSELKFDVLPEENDEDILDDIDDVENNNDNNGEDIDE